MFFSILYMKYGGIKWCLMKRNVIQKKPISNIVIECNSTTSIAYRPQFFTDRKEVLRKV